MVPRTGRCTLDFFVYVFSSLVPSGFVEGPAERCFSCLSSVFWQTCMSTFMHWDKFSSCRSPLRRPTVRMNCGSTSGGQAFPAGDGVVPSDVPGEEHRMAGQNISSVGSTGSSVGSIGSIGSPLTKARSGPSTENETLPPTLLASANAVVDEREEKTSAVVPTVVLYKCVLVAELSVLAARDRKIRAGAGGGRGSRRGVMVGKGVEGSVDREGVGVV